MADNVPEKAIVTGYEKFHRRVLTTMFAKMNAAARLLSKYRFVQGLNIYYSCLSAALGIITIRYSSNLLTMYSVIMSVVLVMSITYQNSQNYLERSRSLDRCYLQLMSLADEIELEETYSLDKERKFKQQYRSIIEDSENHSQFDYHTAIVREKFLWKKSLQKKSPSGKSPSRKSLSRKTHSEGKPRYSVGRKTLVSRIVYYGGTLCSFLTKLLLCILPTVISLIILYVTHRGKILYILHLLRII